MNEFVNFNNRSIELPAGCKGLIDVLPPPRTVRMPVEGFAHIERYLSRLSQSAAARRSVIIWSLDYRRHVRISHRDGAIQMMVVVDTQDTVIEQAVLGLFNELAILPASDSDGRPHGFALRVLIYPLPASVPDAADLIRSFLRRVFGLGDDAGLLFQYHEKNAAS